MKNVLSSALLCFAALSAGAQSSNGLIAHWPMNGNVNDFSGNGHNGIAYNITSAAGISGLPGTAYYFDGTPGSYITVPPSNGFNLFPKQSICATIRPDGFYSGLCQGDFIVFRGVENNAGSFGLLFFDGPYNDCYTLDSNKHVFGTNAGNAVANVSTWQCDSQVHTQHWYKVVATYDSSTYRIYVNGKLTTTINHLYSSNQNIPDSLSIAKYLPGGTTHPYSFKGLIDDLKIYNRVLSDSEVIQYQLNTDSLEIITSGMIVPNSQVTFSAKLMPGVNVQSYKWKLNGADYKTTASFTAEAGVDFKSGDVLSLEVYTNDPLTPYAHAVIMLHVDLAVGRVSLDQVNIEPNPSNGQFRIKGDIGVKEYTLQITDIIGHSVFTGRGIRSNMQLDHRIDFTGMPKGIYLLHVNAGDQTKTLKFTVQ